MLGAGKAIHKCSVKKCKTGNSPVYACRFAKCEKHICGACYYTDLLGKNNLPVLKTTESDDVVACTLRHYKSLAKPKKVVKPATKPVTIRWLLDGRNGPDDPNNSESILMKWICEEGNYSKYKGKDNNAVGRKTGCKTAGCSKIKVWNIL